MQHVISGIIVRKVEHNATLDTSRSINHSRGLMESRKRETRDQDLGMISQGRKVNNVTLSSDLFGIFVFDDNLLYQTLNPT